MEPVNRFPTKAKNSKLFILDILLGIVLTKELNAMCKYVNDVSFPMSDGTDPLNLLSPKVKCFIPIILHKLVGIVPTKELPPNWKYVNDVNFAIFDGIIPVII